MRLQIKMIEVTGLYVTDFFGVFDSVLQNFVITVKSLLSGI